MSANKMRMGIIIAVTLLAGALAAPSVFAQAQPVTWSMAAPLPILRTEMKAATIDGKIYLVGGSWDEATEPERISNYTTGFLTEYNPQTNSWRERARAPEGLTHQAVAALDGKLYVKVKTGQVVEGLMEVSHRDLKAGQEVVILGNESLRDGAAVRKRNHQPQNPVPVSQ